MKELADNDTGTIKGAITQYKQAYDSLLGERLDHTLHFLGYAEYNLNYLVIRMDSGPRDSDESLYPPDHDNLGTMDYGWDSFTQANGVFDALWRSLSHINRTNQMVSTRDFNDSIKMYLPGRLWFGSTQETYCLELIKLELGGYRVLVTLIREVLDDWEQQGNITGGYSWPYALQGNVTQRKGNMASLKSCIIEYKDVVTVALYNISTLKFNAESLKSDTNFDHLTLKSSITDYIIAINQSASLLNEQLESYSAYRISKINLTENLLTRDIGDEVHRHMQSIVFKIDLDAITKLQTETQTVTSSVHKWFISSFKICASFIHYFGYDVIAKLVRTLNLWRKPTVDLRTPGIMKYAYGQGKSWRTWPTSTHLVNLTTSIGSHHISSILDGYMAGINGALYEVQRTLLTTKADAITAFNALWDELKAYRQQSQIDDRFIRYIPLSKIVEIVVHSDLE